MVTSISPGNPSWSSLIWFVNIALVLLAVLAVCTCQFKKRKPLLPPCSVLPFSLVGTCTLTPRIGRPRWYHYFVHSKIHRRPVVAETLFYDVQHKLA